MESQADELTSSTPKESKPAPLIQEVPLASKEPSALTSPHTDAPPNGFNIFSLPPELRDLIYYHHLYRPKGLVWRRLNNHGYKQSTNPWHPYQANYSAHPGDPEIVALFLTSHQVYAEALYVFCAANKVRIERRKYTALPNLLRVFPASAADMLQLLELSYHEYETARHDGEAWTGAKPSHTWARIVLDSHTIKAYFPRVRRFTALWKTRLYFFADEAGHEDWGADILGPAEEGQSEPWLVWLRDAQRGVNREPPRWLFVRFARFVSHVDRSAEYQQAWDGALETIKEEARVKELGMRADELEDSGKMWMEEEWGVGRRQKRRREEDRR
ncbi:hypothetical protein N0V90_011425 [Kalmusia sp. IMI 367209]|nr:hypothetical protein N0V90_011425 [Kalmusia sp. IMI 367209]